MVLLPSLKTFARTLGILQLTGLVATGIIYPLAEQSLLSVALGAFLITNSIGLLIVLFESLTKWKLSLATRSSFARILTRSVIVICATAVGTLLGILVLSFFSPWNYSELLSLNSQAYWRFNVAVIIGVTPVLTVVDRLKARIQRQVRQNEELKLLQARTQLAAIQAKVNPHFLFNTLNTLVNLIHKAPDVAETTVLNLASIYHDVFRLPEKGTILLADEMRLITKFLEVEKARMGPRLDYDISVEPGLENARIVPLLIEPLVENAALHGIGPQPGGGTITIRASRQDQMLVVEVRDDGCGWQSKALDSGFGLYSVQQRIHLLFGDRARLNIRQLPEGGTSVTLMMPYENQNPDS